MKFEKDAEYHVLRSLGVRTDVKEGGSGFVLSEKEHVHGTVTPEDVLRFTEKVGGAPMFMVERLGIVVRSHANHLNPSTGYNVLKAGGSATTATEHKAGVKPAGSASQRMIEYREAQVEKTRTELKKQEGLLAALYTQRTATKAAKAAGPSGQNDALARVLHPESDARQAARAALEVEKARMAAELESLPLMERPEPTADDILQAILDGEMEDSTAPQAEEEQAAS